MKPIIQKLGMLMAVLWVSVSAFAYDFKVDGIYYNITSPSNLEVEVTYNNNSVRAISTSVLSARYYSEACHCKYFISPDYYHKFTYRENTTYSGDIVIPETVNYANKTYTVTAIGNEAFGAWGHDACEYYAPNYEFYKHCEGSPITSVVLPKTVRTIKAQAFSFCRSLKSVTFAEGLETIETNVFRNCPITQLNLPQSLSVIADNAFYNCTQLEEIHLSGETQKSFGRMLFLQLRCVAGVESVKRSAGITWRKVFCRLLQSCSGDCGQQRKNNAGFKF